MARQGADGTWRLWGDKWFCSNANAEVALTLARPEGAPAGTAGLAMFLVPRLLPGGTRNAWTINRLKDKLGARSMASAEVTYAGALAHVVGDPARGFRQMMEMVNVSRLSNAMRAAAIMRRCLLESLVHARARAAFGRALIELPLLRVNLLEMLLDAEAACSVVMNAASALDRWDAGSAADRALFRVLTPVAKAWSTARARVVAGEAMNVRGGNGYIEEWVNPRLLRDSYLGAIWEGATNVVCLDVQRAILVDGGLEAAGDLVRARLATVVEPAVKPWRELVAEQLDAIGARAAGWPALSRAERELEARPVAEALHHVLAASLLLGEGQVLIDRMDSARKLLVGALYARRWLAPNALGAPLYPARILELLDALARWEPISLDSLSWLGA